MISGNLGAAESSAAPLPPFPEDPILAASAEGPFIFCRVRQEQRGHASVNRWDHRLHPHNGFCSLLPSPLMVFMVLGLTTYHQPKEPIRGILDSI